MVFHVVPLKFGPRSSPFVSISPHLSPLLLVLKIVGKTKSKSIKIDSVVCVGITLHHIF